MVFFFFFQAEDGIRDLTVTGVQTCALPISHDGETILEALRRSNLPAAGFLLFDDERRFVSLTRRLAHEETIDAYSLRNPDFAILDPTVQVSLSGEPVAEVFA